VRHALVSPPDASHSRNQSAHCAARIANKRRGQPASKLANEFPTIVDDLGRSIERRLLGRSLPDAVGRTRPIAVLNRRPGGSLAPKRQAANSLFGQSKRCSISAPRKSSTESQGLSLPPSF